ncbi:MAG: hypothetical protein ACQEVA_11390 [Myxococcota bacterium]
MADTSENARVGEPLAWHVEIESSSDRGALELSDGEAAATFTWKRNPRQHGAVLPRWGGHLFAEDGAAGRAFVERIARWLGVSVPASPGTPGVPSGLHYSVEQFSGHDGSKVYRVSTGESRRLSVILRIEEDRERAEMVATEATRSRELVDALAVALRDGPPRAALPAGWSVDDPPLVTDIHRLYHGQYLNCVSTDAGVVGSRREGELSGVYRWGSPGAPRAAVATLKGVVSELASIDSRDDVAAVLVRPSNSRGIGTSDPAILIQLDIETGETRTILSAGVIDPFGSVAWAPNGRFLAVELAGKRIGIVDVSAGRVIEKVPVVGGELLRWDQRGIWVRVRKRDASGWFEAHLWNPETNALEAVSPTRSMSPTGAYDVRKEQGALVINGASGAERALEHPAEASMAARPGFPGCWIDDSRIILEGEEPIVLDARSLSMRYLLPRGRIRRFSVSDGLVIFAPRQGERWCGRMEL